MATLETQQLDNIISSRRALILGGSALAGLALAGKANAQTTTTPGDSDILNFALNLEYLEANFYYLAAFGFTIDQYTTPIAITGTGTQGTVIHKANPKVPFQNVAVGAYCVETALEEGKHVSFLRNALGSAAVAQPAIDLQNTFNSLASLSGVASSFDPFSNDTFFLVGAYIFEDVGVSAYSGAAPGFTTTSTGKTYLSAAAGILAVEAYHAGLIRTTINSLDPTGSQGLQGITQLVSKLRAQLSLAANAKAPNPDDIGLGAQTVSLAGVSSPASTLLDVNASAIAFARNTTQVLNIVTGGGAVNGSTTVSPAKGGFFPNGMNGLIK